MRLFDRLFGGMIDRRIAEYQNDLIAKHCDEVRHMYSTMRGWRHDYHNHIQALIALSGDADSQREYLLKLNDDLTHVDTIIKTGNVMVDAILNSKLSLINSRNISVNAKAVVPSALSVSEIDLCAIIGNLLDNAMEACADSSDMWIRVFIGVMKGQLYISVTNSVAHSDFHKGKFSTSKGDGHGFGLMRIDRIAQKYSGYVNRQREDTVFATEVMLPL